jgi:protein LTV1
MAPKKSIFRQPGAQHFQLVHRSQRDPLYHDPDASKHVLKPFERENAKKVRIRLNIFFEESMIYFIIQGKSRAELELSINPNDLAHDLERANIGEAALYGVYFDDTEYDYMQHLKQVGENGEFESILLEAPRSKDKGKERAIIELKHDLPAETLPSTSELPRNYESQEAVPSSIAGFQPDMDPHLRQTLEALEDDAFVDGEMDDDFFGQLVADGEREEAEDILFEFAEDGLADDEAAPSASAASDEPLPEDAPWEMRFAHFKRAQKSGDDGCGSEDGDTIGTLPALSVIGGKRRRKGTSEASGYSMSSSSMFRNEGLTNLDERFDKVNQLLYVNSIPWRIV